MRCVRGTGRETRRHRRASLFVLGVALTVVAATVLFALGGCGATSGPETTARATPSLSPSTQKPPAPSPGATKTQAATRIVFVNVGQGDAMLIKSGRADVLVDGGPEGAARRVAAAMRRSGIRDLDTVVVTHPHADHVGAVDDLTRSYDPERVLVAGRCDPAVRRAARAAGARLVQTRRGDTYRWGAVKVRVLSPGRLSRDANADSLVLLLEVDGSPDPAHGGPHGCERGPRRPPLRPGTGAVRPQGLPSRLALRDRGQLPVSDRPAIRGHLGGRQRLRPPDASDGQSAARRGRPRLHDAQERHDHADDRAVRLGHMAFHQVCAAGGRRRLAARPFAILPPLEQTTDGT